MIAATTDRHRHIVVSSSGCYHLCGHLSSFALPIPCRALWQIELQIHILLPVLCRKEASNTGLKWLITFHQELREEMIVCIAKFHSNPKAQGKKTKGRS